MGREGELGSAVDLSVYREADVPCIPGSSLKGVFRSYLEVLDKAPHDPWSSKRELCECNICKIFGNTTLASHVRVYDAYAKDGYGFLYKSSVSIDRGFGAQRPGLLFTEEFVAPGCEWCFKMDIINIDFPSLNKDGRVRLLQSLFDALKNGRLCVGARVSVGSGTIRLKDGFWRRYEISDGRIAKKNEGAL